MELKKAIKADVSAMTASQGAEARNAGGNLEGALPEPTTDKAKSEAQRLMEPVVERNNLWQAYAQVMRNDGAPGIDGMRCEDLTDHLKQHWPSIKEKLLSGRYVPQMVRKVEIPKPQGGTRTLGIPTVLDRLIQQALHQVLQPLFEPEFSNSSYGFRPARSAHQAVKAAQEYVRTGRRFVVDIDLEKFFDRVNHDILMSKISQKIEDQRVLTLIRRYLMSGLVEGGITTARAEGTPQGGPLSPLLSNILLNELDRELEGRNHKFCRYADDCNIYVRSKRAGERVMASITSYLENKLKLKVNANKSAVARPWERKFLGYSMTPQKEPRLKIAKESVKRLEAKIRMATKASRGKSIRQTIDDLNPLLQGWMAYFKLTETKLVLEEMDGWIRRKLRCIVWRQWKRPVTRQRNLAQLGISKGRAWESASNGRGPWWNAGASHMNAAMPKKFFDRMGLISLLDTQQRLQRIT